MGYHNKPGKHGKFETCPSAEVMKKIKAVWGDHYDYSKFVYMGARVKSIVICRVHGEFEVTPHHHYGDKVGCRWCAFERNFKCQTWTEEQFMDRVNRHHGVGEYSLVGKYTKSTEKCKMRHNKCGYEWMVHANSMMRGHGCRNCTKSRGENKIEKVLKEMGLVWRKDRAFDDLKNPKTRMPLYFDFCVETEVGIVCIEYDGEHHFKAIRFGGPECSEESVIKSFKNIKYRDKLKNEYCKTNKIPLIRIPYWKFNEIEKILPRKLKKFL